MAEINYRRTLSGKRVPADQHLPTWHELVQKPKPVEPKQHTPLHPDLSTPESLAVTEFPADYCGGRSPRPSSVYSKALRLTLGAALTARREARHPQRVAKRNAIRAAKARSNRMDRAA